VLRSVRDTVPKQVGYFLVTKTQDKLNQQLWHRINSNERIASMLGEPPSVTERRKQLNSTINVLKNALKVIQRDPE
jgi:dynamin 1-like protein